MNKRKEYEARRYRTPRRQAQYKASRLKRYGLTPAHYGLLMLQQNGKCGVCGRPLTPGKHTHIDHRHDHDPEFDTVRGLLCSACNRAEGEIKKSGLGPCEFARRLTEYLDNPPYYLLRKFGVLP